MWWQLRQSKLSDDVFNTEIFSDESNMEWRIFIWCMRFVLFQVEWTITNSHRDDDSNRTCFKECHCKLECSANLNSCCACLAFSMRIDDVESQTSMKFGLNISMLHENPSPDLDLCLSCRNFCKMSRFRQLSCFFGASDVCSTASERICQSPQIFR